MSLKNMVEAGDSIMDSWPEGAISSGDEDSGDVSDRTGDFRYSLWRTWDRKLPRVLFIMLNPSSKNERETIPHPTRYRCKGFAKQWGYGTLLEGNLYGWRCTHPSELLKVPDPVGSSNDECVARMCRMSNLTVVAWGDGIPRLNIGKREHEMLNLLKRNSAEKVFSLGRTKKGHPYHPLYRSGNTQPQPFTRTV